MGDGRLAGAVDGLAGQRDEAGLRAEADDPTLALLDHHAAGRLAGEEGASDVDVEGQGEVVGRDVLGRVLGPRPALFTSTSSRPNEETVSSTAELHLLEVRHVHRDAERAAAHRRDLVGQVLRGLGSRSPSATSAPALASASEIARPRPRAAPVTRATWPFRSNRGKSTEASTSRSNRTVSAEAYRSPLNVCA